MTLTTPASRPLATPDAAGRHVVEFYDTEEFLVTTVAGFAGAALDQGGAVIVVATAAHRRAFRVALRAAGVDLAAAAASDRYLTVDAAQCLRGFMTGEAPDRKRFAGIARDLIDRAGAGGRQVRIYGEMVALLWDAGDVDSAIALDDLWNDLAGERDFMLLCAYPMTAFQDTTSRAAFERICDLHSTVIPTEDYAVLDGKDAQQRVVARLQQQTAALRADVARLRADHVVAELESFESRTAGPGLLQSERRPARRRLATTNPRASSPGGRLVAESLATLSGRLRYAE